MAGVIDFSRTPDITWSAGTSLFVWVLKIIARDTTNEGLAQHIDEIIQNNLGILVIQDLTAAQREEVFRILREDLFKVAENTFPKDTPGREGALEHIYKLVRLVPPPADTHT